MSFGYYDLFLVLYFLFFIMVSHPLFCFHTSLLTFLLAVKVSVNKLVQVKLLIFRQLFSTRNNFKMLKKSQKRQKSCLWKYAEYQQPDTIVHISFVNDRSVPIITKQKYKFISYHKFISFVNPDCLNQPIIITQHIFHLFLIFIS